MPTKKLTNPKILGNLALQTIELKLGRIHLRSRPFIIQVEGTNKCNLSCPMCYRRFQNRKIGEMSFEEL